MMGRLSQLTPHIRYEILLTHLHNRWCCVFLEVGRRHHHQNSGIAHDP